MNAEIRMKLRKEKVESIADPNNKNSKKYLYIDSMNIKGDEKYLREILDEIQHKDQREKLELPKIEPRRHFSKLPELFSQHFVNKIGNYEQEVQREMRSKGRGYLAPTLIELPEISDQEEPNEIDSPIKIPKIKSKAKTLTNFEPKSGEGFLQALKKIQNQTTSSIGDEENNNNTVPSIQSDRVRSVANLDESELKGPILQKAATHREIVSDENNANHLSTEATFLSPKQQEDTSILQSGSKNNISLENQTEVKQTDHSIFDQDRSSRTIKFEIKTEPDQVRTPVRPVTFQPEITMLSPVNKSKYHQTTYDGMSRQMKIVKSEGEETSSAGVLNVHALNRSQNKDKRRDKGDLFNIHASPSRQGISDFMNESGSQQESKLHKSLKKKLDSLSPSIKLDNPVFLTALSPVNSKNEPNLHFTLRTPESLKEKYRTTILKLKEINSPSPSRTMTLFRSLSDRKMSSPRAFELTARKKD